MTQDKKTKPPAHLRAETRKWFESVLSEYELEDHHLKLLRLACESWDRCQQARTAISKYGLTYQDRFGAPRLRPEIGVERDSRLAFARMLRELALDVEEPGESTSPPKIYGNANRRNKG